MNIASYFIETLASPQKNNWYHKGGTITQTIDNFPLNTNHQRSVEHTWETLISCIEQGINYTVKHIIEKHGRPYLLNSSSEINILVNSMQNRLGHCYTTLLINFHCQTHGDNAVCRSTVNLSFRRLQPKITKFRKYKKIQRMRVSGKRQRIEKWSNGWSWSTYFMRRNSKQRQQLDSFHIFHIVSYLQKGEGGNNAWTILVWQRKLPYLTPTQPVSFDEVHIQQVIGPHMTSKLHYIEYPLTGIVDTCMQSFSNWCSSVQDVSTCTVFPRGHRQYCTYKGTYYSYT